MEMLIGKINNKYIELIKKHNRLMAEVYEYYGLDIDNFMGINILSGVEFAKQNNFASFEDLISFYKLHHPYIIPFIEVVYCADPKKSKEYLETINTVITEIRKQKSND